MTILATRHPWPTEFPDVIVHTTVSSRDAHPDYTAAKTGDPDAALTLAIDLLDDTAIAVLRNTIRDRHAMLLPVIADETMGFNAIPDAMAQVLGRDLDLPVVAGEIVQINKVGHTRAPAFQRLVTPAMFDGGVQRDAAYVLVWAVRRQICAATSKRGADRSLPSRHLPKAGTPRAFHCDRKHAICYGAGMAKSLISSDEPNSAMGSTASRKSKPSSYVVSNPLPASRIFWLRQQSKHVAAVSIRRLDSAAPG